VRENMLFGARTIKLCIDCKPWGYSVDDIKLAIREAARGGCKVEGHVQTADGAQRSIDAGVYIIAHGTSRQISTIADAVRAGAASRWKRSVALPVAPPARRHA
jgi:imidazolonepropionase-like amidohydrolase